MSDGSTAKFGHDNVGIVTELAAEVDTMKAEKAEVRSALDKNV